MNICLVFSPHFQSIHAERNQDQYRNRDRDKNSEAQLGLGPVVVQV